MKFITSTLCFLLIYSHAISQKLDTKWYSETNHNGVVIQNSFPKGGPYTGPTKEYFNYSYLVFYSRVVNKTEKQLELVVNLPDSTIGIPNSPDTFVRLFIPPDTMTLEKQNLFSYGITEFKPFDKSSLTRKTLNPESDCLFYMVAIFYQTKADAQNQSKGGNRAEIILKGQDLFYRMSPQIESMLCGHINFID